MRQATGKTVERPAEAQQAAKVRTGTYTERNGTTSASPAQPQGNARRPYGKTVENPYGRYTSGGEDDAEYTASFKPEERRINNGNSRRRRNGGTGDGETHS